MQHAACKSGEGEILVKYIIVDIETDGPCPYPHSILSLGACTLDEPEQTWYRTFQPLKDGWGVPDTVKWLKENGLDRDKLITEGSDPYTTMVGFDTWLTEVAQGDRLRFVADNAGFDWMFVCWYLYEFVGRNQFGFSPLSLTSLYHGYVQDIKRASEWKKKYRTVQHSHNALDDARGNAGAMRTFAKKGIKF